MSNVITKGITSTIVSGFTLDEMNIPKPTTIKLEGALTRERAEGKARKVAGNILVTSVEQVRSYFELDRDIAMEHATNERVNADDIQLGETGTTVYYVRLVKAGSFETCEESIHFDAPMTETRAFGAARRACDFDILPVYAEQSREVCYLSRAKFFELAKPVSETSENEQNSDDSENDEIA